MDAEYYQAKYEKMLEKVSTLKTEKLESCVEIKKSIEPGSYLYRNEGIPFVRVQDLSKWGISKTSVYLPAEYTFTIEINLKKNTILLSKAGTCGIAYNMQEDMEAITSGAILSLRVKNEEKILPDYLTLVLNSPVVQLQAERDIAGSIIKHWRIEQINNVIVPIIYIAKQEEISNLCQKSFELKRKAYLLLQDAIKEVEKKVEEVIWNL